MDTHTLLTSSYITFVSKGKFIHMAFKQPSLLITTALALGMNVSSFDSILLDQIIHHFGSMYSGNLNSKYSNNKLI